MSNELTNQQLANGSVQGWMDVYNIKNEKGEPITFHQHQYLKAIYNDQSQYLVVMKAAQVGMSTCEILKNIRDAERYTMDIIYTLPTDEDVKIFVGGKVNRIIANNPHLMALVADKDSVEQKKIGESMIYFRGTWSKKAAIMVTGDRLIHDEKDSSKQDVIADYKARLQHSKFKQIHSLSHPSTANSGVDLDWQISDQKEWFVKCPHCNYRQYLRWDTENPQKMNIDLATANFICSKCRKVLDWHIRAAGEWVQKYKNKPWSGYHISLLMAPWVTAKEIIASHQEILDGKQTIDYFYNKILGLPYSGSGNKPAIEDILDCVTDEKNLYQGRLVIGVDTGIKLRYVIGNTQGLVGFGEMSAYSPDEKLNIPPEQSLEYFLKKFPTSVMVIDQGGDIVGSRMLRAKYPGRVFLCHYQKDRKTMQLIKWGEKDEEGNVTVDRNRMISLVLEEFRNKRLKLYNGDKNTWYDYWLHWSHIYRVAEENALGVKEYSWLRSDRDDWAHATSYWRVGISRFGAKGSIVGENLKPEDNSYIINPNETVTFSPDSMFGRRGIGDSGDVWWANDNDEDWRS